MSAAHVDFLQGRPASGFGHYLRDIVLGANDGVVTTMAIVAASAGASLTPRVALILGLANLVADGFSMGVGNYLSLKSELKQRGVAASLERPARHGAATFLAFALVGGVPLVAYLASGVPPAWRFGVATTLAGCALLGVGIWRARFVGSSRVASALEVLLIGGLATAAAYAIGILAERALLD